LRQALAARGYQATKPTEVHVAWVNPLAAFASPTGVDLDDAPDAAWGALFMGPGFDPVDGAARVQNLSRATGTAYASMRAPGMTLAAGAGAFSHGWLSIHGMRTDANHRGKGLAGQILSAFATLAHSRGIARCFLQVEQANAPALALYRRAGFERAWSYAYWRRDLRC
jgi:ribosomal protein S18 acetylase RimI-like enzyme